MAFLSINEYLNRRHAAYRIRVEVLKDNGTTWLDLSDRVSHDRVLSLPGLTKRQTRTVGAAEVSVNTVVMDNSDRFWDGTPPSGITTWHRHQLRVTIVAPPSPRALATVLIDDVETSSDSEQATLRLVGLSKRLIDKQADRVKNGRDWYTNRSIGWLVRQLLLQDFKVAEVELWPDVLSRYQIPLADPTDRAVSAYGRPPEFDGTNWRNDGTTLYGAPYAVVNDATSAHYGEHWVGIGGELWRYQPDTDIWTRWCGMPPGRTNHKIMHIYISATRDKVVCVAWAIDVPAAAQPYFNAESRNGYRSGALSGDVAIFGNSMTSQQTYLNEFAGQPLNIYTGHYFIRAGRDNGAGQVTVGANDTGTADAFCSGLNIPAPFGHYVRLRNTNFSGPPYSTLENRHKTSYNTKANADEQGPGVTNPNVWAVDSPGFYAPQRSVAAHGTTPLDWRWSMGQYRGAFALQNTGDIFVCCVISWDSGISRYKFRLWTLNINTQAWTDTGLYVMSGIEHYEPSSFAFRSDDAKLLCAATLWKETAWASGAPVTTGGSEPFGSAVIEFNFPLVDSGAPAGRPNQTLVTLNTNHSVLGLPQRFWLVVYDAVYGASDYVLATGVDIRFVLSGNAYVAVPLRVSTGGYGLYLYSTGRLSGAVYEASTGRWYVQDGGANQVRAIAANTINTVNNPWLFMDSGLPPVPGDPALLMGLVVDKKRSAIWGVSGPGAGAQVNAEVLGDAPLTGKYYLWHLAGWLTDRVELADFSDDGRRGTQAMTVWAALEELAAMMDGVFGFDGNGQFYFKARPGATAPVATLATDSREDTGRVPDCTVRKSRGSRNVFNLVEMTPSIAVLSPPRGAVRVLARPATFNRDPWNVSPEVFQGNNRNLNILLRCVAGGQAGSEDYGVVRKTSAGYTMVDYAAGASTRLHKLRFAFLLYDTLVETQIAGIITLPTDKIRIPLEAAKDIRPVEAGVLSVVNAMKETDEITIADTETYTVRERTDLTSIGLCELRLDRNVTTAWAVGTKLTIRTRGDNRWSDSAAGITSFIGSGLPTSTQGTIQTFEVFSTRDLAPGMILRIDEDGLEEMRILSIVNARTVQVRRGVGGTPAGPHGNIAPLRAYWAPVENADFPAGYRFAIGGTGVSLRFAGLPDTGENPFMVGDAIEIVCDGLSLESQEKAKIISYHVGSIQRLGGQKIPWPAARTSRFAGHRQCVEIARRVTRDYGDEHFDLSVEFPMRWLPDINETYLVEDTDGTLPTLGFTSPNGDFPPVYPDTSYAVAALVESVNIDPMNDHVTVEARAANPHA